MRARQGASRSARRVVVAALRRRDTGRAMSKENVEVVRRGVEALNARDLDRHYDEFFDPEVEWRTSAEDPDAATHRGLKPDAPGDCAPAPAERAKRVPAQ